MSSRKSGRAWLGGTLALLLLAAGSAFAQTGTVTGTVTDAANGAPLIGAQVVIAGTNLSVSTNQQGRYLILGVPAGQQQVRASLIGYGQRTFTVTVTAGQTTVQDLQLETSAIALEALVVNAATGREQRARELGAKVATIEVDQMNPAPITSLADALGGRSEGVIMQDVNGTTGTSQRIRIRGANSISLSNEPLIYVDGSRVSNDFGGFGVGGQEPNRLNDINPNDIESIEIVKGPAASALYGTAAANGVMLITTKRGRPGGVQWSAYAETGKIEDVTEYPVNFLSYQINDASQPLFRADGTFNTAAYSYCPNLSAASGTCRQDGTLRFNQLEDPRTTPFSTGSRRRYGLNLRGGTEEVRFFASGQYEDEVGVIDFNTLERGNFRANLDARLSPTANLSVSVGYTDADLGLNNNDNSIFSPILNGLTGEAYFLPPRDDRPDEVNDANYGFGFNMTELEKLVTYQDVDRYTTSVNLQWRPRTWLMLNGTGGLDLTSLHDFQTLQPGDLPIAVSYANGYRQSRRESFYVYTGAVSAVGTFSLMPDLVSTTTIGGSYDRSHSRNTYCYGSSLVPGTASCGTTAALFDIDENFFEIKTIGAYVQEELGWQDRVFLAASLRGDDNSAFGSDFGFAYYPSASLSWVIGEEGWFPQYDWLSNLRLRTAWGTSGLRPGFRDAVTLYNPTTVATDAGDVPGVSLSSTGNTQLKPERTTEWEVGLDFGLFQDRLGVDFTYFNKTSKDALIRRRLPGSLGLTADVFDNLGSVQNTGTELTARLQVIEREDVGLNLGLTNTSLDNEIKELGEGVEDIIFNRGIQRHKEGYSAGAFFQQRVSYADADGNGVLSIGEVELGDEPEYIGPSIPTWQRSIFADLRLFDFINVSTLFEGRGGHYTGNDSEAFRCGFRSTRGCAAVADPNAPLEEQAAFIADRYLGSMYLYTAKADFWRWRELSVSLTAPRSVTERLARLRGLRLTLAGRNLALFSDYPGLDPETVEGGGDSNFNQSEFNTQPPVRYLMVRLDYSF